MGTSRELGPLRALLRRANLRGAARPFHALRHTFASHYVMAGGNLLALQKLLGHAQIEVTARYLHPGSSRDAADKLEALMTSEPTIATVTPLALARQRRTAAAR